ncbi:MAG: hypothetical protein ACE5JD_12285 [Candidatus Methylomirabilia bacterium]
MKGIGNAPQSLRRILMFLAAMAALTLAAAVPASWAATVELDEAFVRIEINASDGDVGFHGKFDGEPSKLMTIRRPDGEVIYRVRARRNLKRQGLTENFFESAEPTCEEQPLAAFLLRFPTGVYSFEGKTNDGADILEGEFTLTHALPAAPDISAFDGSTVELDDDDSVVIHWGPGTDLGACHDQALVNNGTIPDPANVAVERWEVVVEPDVDVEALGLPFSVFSVQLPPGQVSVTVPFEYLDSYAVAGVTEFKFEVGAKSGENQTFSEGTFVVELDD